MAVMRTMTRWMRLSAILMNAGSRVGMQHRRSSGLDILNIADSIKAHPDFDSKYKNNQDSKPEF